MDMSHAIDDAYYTCLNKKCEHYRGVFRDGDSQHQNCKRERLWLEGQRPTVSVWPWFAAGTAVAVIAVAATVLRPRR